MKFGKQRSLRWFPNIINLGGIRVALGVKLYTSQ